LLFLIFNFHPNLYTLPLNVPTSRNNNNTHSLVSTPSIHTLRIRLPPLSLTIHGNNACEFHGHRRADSCPIGSLSLLLQLIYISDMSMFCLWSYDGHRACSRLIRRLYMTWTFGLLPKVSKNLYINFRLLDFLEKISFRDFC